MRHLGPRTSAYVDGGLTGSRLRRAEAHLRRCPWCAEQVAWERELSLRLRSLERADVPVGLTERIPGPPQPPGKLRRLGWTVTDRVSLPAWRHRAAVRAVVGGSALVTTLGVVILVGAAQDVTVTDADVMRAGASATVAGAPVVTRLAASGADDSTATAAALLRDAGWVFPADLPPGLHIAGVSLHRDAGREVLEVEVAGGGGSARVLEVRGRVEAGAVPADAVVVQCGEIAVVLAGNTAVRDEIAALLPSHGFDSSPVGRLDRGMQAVVSFFGEVGP